MDKKSGTNTANNGNGGMASKVVAIIPIKLNSTRIPQKNIKKFYDGTPLAHFIQKVCLSTHFIDEVYVYCSDDAIKDYILPGVTFLKRPDYLDSDKVNGNDIIREFMKTVDADIYVNANTTSPFSKPKTIDECIYKVINEGFDSAFCVENIRTFLWKDNKPLNFDPDHFPRTQDLPKILAETSIAYVFRKGVFIKYNRRLGVNPFIKEVGKIEAIDIDYPEDFEIANAIYKGVIKNGNTDY